MENSDSLDVYCLYCEMKYSKEEFNFEYCSLDCKKAMEIIRKKIKEQNLFVDDRKQDKNQIFLERGKND
jgi:hypothetical protein